jgi:hypothetical protein
MTTRRPVVPIIAALAAVTVLAGTAAPATAQMSGGFYRQAQRPEVYWQYSAYQFCHVQNPAQMNAYGGFAQVRVMQNPPLRGEFAGPCPWPDGFWRRSDRPEVYLIRRGRICHVINPTQMDAFGGFGRVRVVPPDSRVTVGLGRVVPCPWP